MTVDDPDFTVRLTGNDFRFLLLYSIYSTVTDHNIAFLVPDSWWAIEKHGISISAGVIDDAFENIQNDACFSYFQTIWHRYFKINTINTVPDLTVCLGVITHGAPLAREDFPVQKKRSIHVWSNITILTIPKFPEHVFPTASVDLRGLLPSGLK